MSSQLSKTQNTIHSNDNRLIEGYHPTLWEQIRLFIIDIWQPKKFKGMIDGLSYVKKANIGIPKIGDSYINCNVYTVNGECKNLSDYITNTPLVLNFGSYT